jgi:putative Holliday junction resolvase
MPKEQKRLMGIDPGARRIGIALTDPSGRFPKPFGILTHVSRQEDARRIADLAKEKDVVEIIIGLSTDEDGQPSPSGRSAQRLAQEIKNFIGLPIHFWNEEQTTNLAQEVMLELGVPKKKRQGHQDDMAAALLLQSYLERHGNKDIE